MSDINPRPVPVPPPNPASIPQHLMPGDGRPPLRTGSLVMSEALEKQLGTIGWQKGDPIPGDLGQEIKKIQDQVFRERDSASLQDSPLGQNYVPPKNKTVDIASLPPEKQAELRQYLADYKAQVEAGDQQMAAAGGMEASIPDSVQGSMRAATLQAMQIQQAAEHSGIVAEVIDDGPAVHAPPAGVKIPEGKQYAGMVGGSNVAQKIEQMAVQAEKAKAPPPAPKAEPEPASAGAVSGVQLHVCPRCTYPVDQPFDVEFTSADKKKFMISMLGLQRFEKTYDLLGGQLKVKFRTLDASETTAIQNCLADLSKSGKIGSMADYMAWMKELRLVLSVVGLQSGDVPLNSVPQLATWWAENRQKYGSNGEEKLLKMKDWFYEQIVPQEPIRRMLGQQFSLFQRLVEGLEANSANPDFWSGIELHD